MSGIYRPDHPIEHLFVDCDDTLVMWTWGEAVGVHRNALPVPSKRVARFVKAWWAAKPDRRRVTVWSLGGAEWAAEVAARCLPGVRLADAQERYPKLPLPGEIFLDDDPFDTYASQAIHPKHLCSEPDFFHGGQAGMVAGDWILPPSVTGRTDTLLDYNEMGRAAGDFEEVLPARRDRVYVANDPGACVVLAATHPSAGDLYFVAPIGPLEPDPDALVPNLSFECRAAIVLGVLPIADEHRERLLAEAFAAGGPA